MTRRILLFSLLVAACGGAPEKTPETPRTPETPAVARCDLKETSDGCGLRPTSLAKLWVAESFAHDYGCHPGGVIVDCQPFDLDDVDEQGHQAILSRLGWQKGDRAALAMVYAIEVWYADHVIRDATPEFGVQGRPAFTPPKSTVRADGGVEVEFWVRARSGMRPDGAPDYYHNRVSFSADGSKVETVEIEAF